MEQFLSLVGMQAMKLAVKSGIVFTSSYALQQYSHFLTTVTDEKLSLKLKTLQDELDSRIKKGITSLGHKIASLTSAKTSQAAIRHLVADIKVLIERINGSIPLLQLAISASGESLATNLPESVSPSRMLQASAFLMVADSQLTASPRTTVQVGPDFIVSVYMIFKGYSYGPANQDPLYKMSEEPNLDSVRKPAWQEVLHKARLKLHRAPCQPERNGKQWPRGYSRYFYYLEIKGDTDDGRLHDNPTDSVGDSKIDLIPVTEITKLLYTNSAAILNIKDDLEANSTPILLLKREIDFTTLSNTPEYNKNEDETQQHVDCQILSECDGAALDGENGKCGNTSLDHSQFPSYLDPEWIALEMYTADASDGSQYDQSDAESAQSSSDESEQRKSHETVTDEVINQLSSLCLSPVYPPHSEDKSALQDAASSVSESTPTSLFSMVTTSLSLLELVIRLAVLQQTQQKSHLSIPDHVLTCFLNGTMQPNNFTVPPPFWDEEGVPSIEFCFAHLFDGCFRLPNRLLKHFALFSLHHFHTPHAAAPLQAKLDLDLKIQLFP
ncbi:hypothetical protein MY5147_007231 [Beauveria neobassiana]